MEWNWLEMCRKINTDIIFGFYALEKWEISMLKSISFHIKFIIYSISIFLLYSISERSQIVNMHVEVRLYVKNLSDDIAHGHTRKVFSHRTIVYLKYMSVMRG